MALLKTFFKQPGDTQDYDIYYDEYILAMGEALADAHTVSATAEAGLTLGDVTIVDGVVKVWTSGGTTGETYKITVIVTTAGGRVHESEVAVKVKET
jgi:hypothetical protein